MQQQALSAIVAWVRLERAIDAFNLELKRDFGVTVTGPRAEADKIEGLDVLVGPGEPLALGKTAFEIIATPGHTLGHIAYFDRAGLHLFTGDALFSLGWASSRALATA